MIEDYKNVIEIVLEDGIISPSEDQMLWAMRQQLGIDEQGVTQIVQNLFESRKNVQRWKNGGTLPRYAAWYRYACEVWVLMLL